MKDFFKKIFIFLAGGLLGFILGMMAIGLAMFAGFAVSYVLPISFHDSLIFPIIIFAIVSIFFVIPFIAWKVFVKHTGGLRMRKIFKSGVTIGYFMTIFVPYISYSTLLVLEYF